MINPYAIIGALLLLIVTALGGAHIGKKLEREKWQAEKIQMQAEHTKAIEAEFDRYARMVKFNDAKARKASEDHAKELDAQKTAHVATVARTRAAGGLRIDRAACAAKDAATSQGSGTGRPDGSAAGAEPPPGSPDRNLQAEVGSIRLPTEVENDLFDLVEDADKLATQLRNLQKWVRDNGHYGQTE